MLDSNITENEFLNKLTQIIEDNISDDRFGVSELAGKIGMSRSNLLRKVKKSTNLSVSQYIRNARLKKAMDLLQKSDLNISEVSYTVGFSSSSYFTKCFHDHFGFPPGEANSKEPISELSIKNDQKRKAVTLAATIILAFLIAFLIFHYLTYPKSTHTISEKSIAVLPFKNDSEDLSNTYIVNGLMESILNNLQKIQELKVISRTSVEKFRTNPKTIPEIAHELNVNYIVEGSGQKIGDKLLLNIQLIDARTDVHLWSEQFERNTSDIFDLQREVAKKIAEKVKVIVTPDEKARIDKKPTENIIAYDYFLKGYDQITKGTRKGLEDSIENFNKAVENDSAFARAYAGAAMAYYYLDAFQKDKKYKDYINYYADKALFYDSKLAQSLIAKSLYYQSIGECKLAVPYLEKALNYNPNSALALNFLSDIYTSCLPNTAKYLENAILGLELNIAANDSTTTSFNFLHVANAFIQTGFVREAEYYIGRSLAFNPDNLYSEYVQAYILFAKEKDLKKTKERLIRTFQKDTTRLDVMQEIAKIHYYMRDNNGAYKYFKKFNDTRERYNLDIYRHMNGEIAAVYSEMDFNEEANTYLADFKNYIDNNTSLYQKLELSMYYSFLGDIPKALSYFKQFAKEEDDYHYWTILFLKLDPMMDNLKQEAGFQDSFALLESKFWERHSAIRKSLNKKYLLLQAKQL